MPDFALKLGNEIYPRAFYASGKAYVFSQPQLVFLSTLEKTHDLQASAHQAKWDLEQAKRFLSSRKFRSFRNGKMHEFSIRQGVTVEWWYEFGKNLTEGKRTFFEGECTICKTKHEFNEYEVESSKDDNLEVHMQCPNCLQEIIVNQREEEFFPSREQVEGWKEFGSRLIPKVERVQHEFSDENFKFVSEEDDTPTAA